MKFQEIAFYIFLCYSAMLINIIVHETGHALAYKINGIRFIMNFGKGEPLFRLSQWLIIRKRYLVLPFPFAYVQYHPGDEEKAKSMPVRQEIFVSAAGVLLQGLFLTLLTAGSLCFSLPGFVRYYMNGTIVIGLLSILLAVFPSPFHVTDGVSIFRILKRIRKTGKKTDK